MGRASSLRACVPHAVSRTRTRTTRTRIIATDTARRRRAVMNSCPLRSQSQGGAPSCPALILAAVAPPDSHHRFRALAWLPFRPPRCGLIALWLDPAHSPMHRAIDAGAAHDHGDHATSMRWR
jgi:hypothetical protein